MSIASEHVPLPNRAATFRVAVLASFTSGLIATYRAAIAAQMRNEFFVPVDALHATGMIGAALGSVFLGFSVMLLLGSALLPMLGFRRALYLCSTFMTIGLGITIVADQFVTASNIIYVLLFAMTLQGAGWGLLEGTVNPLAGALYPKARTHYLNLMHAYYPAGVVVGALMGLWAGIPLPGWRILTLVAMALSVTVAVCAGRVSYPPIAVRPDEPTSFKAMFRGVLTRPVLLGWMVVMMMTSIIENVPNQWVDLTLSQTVGMRGTLLLAYVSVLMFVLRHFAGPLERRLSNIGLLLISCMLACLGLLALAHASSPPTAMLAATIWGLGICYLWPTMLSTVSARHAAGGPLVFGLIGSAGNGSVYFVLPMLGTLYDSAKLAAAGNAQALQTAKGEKLDYILRYAATQCFHAVAAVAALASIVFAFILLPRLLKGPAKFRTGRRGVDGHSDGDAVTTADAPFAPRRVRDDSVTNI